MPIFGPLLLLLSATAAAAAAAAAQGVPRPVLPLHQLTVPKDRLPDGCSLTATQSGYAIGWQRLTSNPWIGTDRAILGGLRGLIDGPGRRPLPDALTTSLEEAELRSALAEGVEEGYAATYEQLSARALQVLAVRFAVPPEPRFRPSDGAPGAPARIALGSTWILFDGDNGACSKAIEAYLRSFRK